MGELLGVAGTDVPIAEIVKLVPAHMVRGWTTLYRNPKIPKNHFTTFSLVLGATALQWTTTVTCSIIRTSDQWQVFHQNICSKLQINCLLQFAGEILKPNYNSLDLVEVELVDDAANEGPRQNSSQLFLVRHFSYCSLLSLRSFCFSFCNFWRSGQRGAATE